jgi:hypothetical protein
MNVTDRLCGMLERRAGEIGRRPPHFPFPTIPNARPREAPAGGCVAAGRGRS